MPAHTLTLAATLDNCDIHLEVSRPPWLFARTYKMLGRVGMFVTRSVMLHETDEWCDPINELLSKCRAELVRYSEFDCEGWFGGRVEWKFYLIHRKDDSDRGIDLDPAFVEQMRRQYSALIQTMSGGRAS